MIRLTAKKLTYSQLETIIEYKIRRIKLLPETRVVAKNQRMPCYSQHIANKLIIHNLTKQIGI